MNSGSFKYITCKLFVYNGLMSGVFTNGPGDQDSIPGWVIPKTQKMVFGAALLNTQPYSVLVKGTSFPGFLHFTLDAYLIIVSIKQCGIKYHFVSLWYDST